MKMLYFFIHGKTKRNNTYHDNKKSLKTVLNNDLDTCTFMNIIDEQTLIGNAHKIDAKYCSKFLDKQVHITSDFALTCANGNTCTMETDSKVQRWYVINTETYSGFKKDISGGALGK